MEDLRWIAVPDATDLDDLDWSDWVRRDWPMMLLGK